MNEKVQQVIENLVPFLMIGVAIALVIGLFIMFSYVLVWGLLIGGILWILSIIKALVFPSESNHTLVKSKGRIIEHNDKD